MLNKSSRYLRYIPNAKPIIGSVRLFGLLRIDTARLVLIKDLSNSSKIKFWEYVSSNDNNLISFEI